uniref:Uncharacterized protein n=1 Tax=Magallana gigas TaxID=29159 RepID=A0A8W8JXT4_MAGGI|nr:uncharacterized protein LOC105327481 [Crassostrea gigas]
MSLFFKSVTFLIISWIFIFLKDAQVTSRPTETEGRCPYNESEWKEWGAKMFCQGSDSYHCFLAEDGFSVKESCIQKTLILNGFCPFFTDEGYLHWSPCNGTACPNSSYKSEEAYKYQICFKKKIKLSQVTANSDVSGEEYSAPSVSLIIGILIGVVVIALLVSVFVYKKFQNKTDEDVKNGLDVLETNDIVYVVGRLGNSVSTVGKEIACKHAQKKKMSVEYLNYLGLSTNFGFSDNTVYFVDGWFGLWNDNPCERESVKENLGLIFQERHKKVGEKFVVGLSSEIRKTYAEFFEENWVLFSPSETILLDRSSTKKKEKVKTRLDALKKKCSMAECPCHKLELEHIIDGKKLGPHLIINLVSLDHSLATVLIDESKTPLDHMTEQFQRLYRVDEELFKGILYLVLNGVYDEEDFISLNVGEFTITRDNMTNPDLEAYTKRIQFKNSEQQKSKLAPTWSSIILGSSKERNIVHVFWHNFLYICAFRACYNLFPEMVMMHCNLDAILQLVRPIGQGGHFAVETDVELITKFYEKRIKVVRALDVNVGEHPLVLKYRNEHAGNDE